MLTGLYINFLFYEDSKFALVYQTRQIALVLATVYLGYQPCLTIVSSEREEILNSGVTLEASSKWCPSAAKSRPQWRPWFNSLLGEISEKMAENSK